MPQYYFFFTGFDRGDKPELEQHLGPWLRELRRPRPPPTGRPPSKQSRHPPPGHTQDKPNGRSVRYQTKEPFFTRDTLKKSLQQNRPVRMFVNLKETKNIV